MEKVPNDTNLELFFYLLDGPAYSYLNDISEDDRDTYAKASEVLIDYKLNY